ncbi:MAG: hypothetical protein JWO37_1320 [Acidimicrobiales bacterium]|nr:hypothetical protein [Acidimicrobiales bacterium]
MQRKNAVRSLALLVVLTFITAACSSGRGSSTASGTTATTAAAAAAVKFGTLDSPCGKGDAKGVTEQGVTDTSITIEYGDDSGFAGSPGLQHEMGNAIKGMIKWCNDQGGILGRQINGIYGDAAYANATARVQEACKTAFMLVGEGWAADESAEQVRLGCNLIAVPGYSVGPNFANAPEMYQAVPNPDDYLPNSPAYQMAAQFPDAVKKAAFLHTTLTSATESSFAKSEQAFQKAGWNWLNCGVTINYFGEPDYKPFVKKFQQCGAQLLFINISPGAPLFNFIQAMDQLNYHPVILGEANLYSAAMAAWNTKGLGDKIYVREAFKPLEDTADPAIKAYLDIVKAVNGDVSQLGAQSASSFLLWATAAKECGSTLTRQCIVNNISKVHDWTGGGLHANTDPGANLPPKCGLLMHLTGTKFEQFFPTTLGELECKDEYRVQITGAAVGTTLGPDRIATKFLGGTLIKPQ